MPGIPCVYYGSEWGLEGKRTNWSDDDLRPYLDHPEWNALCDHIQKLAEIRRTCSALSYGNYRQVYTRNEQWAFTRTDESGTLLFAVNISAEEAEIRPDVFLPEGVDLLTGKKTDPSKGIRLAGKSSVFIQIH